MNGGKFASLTAGLLVRKGEAHPSMIGPASVFNPSLLHTQQTRAQSFEEFVPDAENSAPPDFDALDHTPVYDEPEPPAERIEPAPRRRKAASGMPPPRPPAKPRRLMVTLSPQEFETLGHMSVKKGTTRHRLLRNALDEYMSLLGEEFGGYCQCIYTGCSCD